MILGRRVMVVGAHPDDLEMNAGGTINKLSRSGAQVYALTLATHSTQGNTRLTEQDRAQRILGIQGSMEGRYDDRDLASQKLDAIRFVEECVSVWEPDTVITHFHADTHQDHASTYEIVAAGARKVPNVLLFKPTYPSGRCDIAFHPTFVSRLSESDMAAKLRAMSEFKSQILKYGEDAWLDSLKAAAAGDAWTYGGFHGYAEVFQVSRIIS